MAAELDSLEIVACACQPTHSVVVSDLHLVLWCSFGPMVEQELWGLKYVQYLHGWTRAGNSANWLDFYIFENLIEGDDTDGCSVLCVHVGGNKGIRPRDYCPSKTRLTRKENWYSKIRWRHSAMSRRISVVYLYVSTLWFMMSSYYI